MKRRLLPLLLVLAGLAAALAIVLLFSLQAATDRAEASFDETTTVAPAAGRRTSSVAPASDVRAHGTIAEWRAKGRLVNAYPYPVENVLLHVNYAYDAVEGNAEQAGVTVAITVTAFDDSPKANAVVSTESDGYFSVDCLDWSVGDCPDFVPGDKILARAQEATTEISPIGSISGRLDEATDTVSGTLLAPGQTGLLNVTCQVLTDPGSAVIHKTADANGGAFSCDFLTEAGWDLQWGDQVALTYEESDGDMVSNVPPWSWARVNYGHEWAGMNYDLGHTFQLTVTDDGGAVKGTAEATSTSGGGWGGPGFQTEPGQWSPAPPDIAPGDWVHFAADDGYRNSIQVGTISGALDADADRLAGQILAPHFAVSLTVECHPWGAWDIGIDAPVKVSLAEPDGSLPFACQWGPGEWDVQVGQEAAAMYLEPDWDRVINVFEGSVAFPELTVDKTYSSSRLPRAMVTYTLRFSNVAGALATGLVISDQLPVNVTWLNGGAYDAASKSITWTWPSLDVGQSAEVHFSGELACGGPVVNDQYLVVSSEQGVGSAVGPAVAFDIISPTITLTASHPSEPVAGGLTHFQATADSNGPAPLSYAWAFGDGQVGSGASPSHVYQSTGEFTVVLTASDPCGYQAIYEKVVTVREPSIAPDFDQSDQEITVNNAVAFTDTTSTDGAEIVAWRWDFGDGSPPSVQQNATHTYDTRGTYTVTLVVTDALGYAGQVAKASAVTVLARVFEISKAVEGSQLAGSVVTYTLTVSNVGDVAASGLVITDRLPSNVTWISGGDYHGGSGIITWQWSSLAAGATAEVQFSGRLGCSGLVVNDRYRVADSDQGVTSPWGPALSFPIVAPTITAGFSQSAAEVIPGQTVFFTSTSATNGRPLTTFSWDFGDGQNGDGAAVSHVFDGPGHYDVVLTAADACGYQDIASETVVVKSISLLPIIAVP